MKKLSLYVFLGLLFCNVGLAEQFILECTTKYKVSNEGKKILPKYLFKFIFDLDKKNYRYSDTDDILNLIVKENEFLEYHLGPAFGGGFSTQIIKWNRLSGERIAYSSDMSVEKWKKFKIELDKINSNIKNYKKDLDWGDESYNVSNLGTFDQEMQKYKIIEKFTKIDEYAVWQCEKSNKAF